PAVAACLFDSLQVAPCVRGLVERGVEDLVSAIARVEEGQDLRERDVDLADRAPADAEAVRAERSEHAATTDLKADVEDHVVLDARGIASSVTTRMRQTPPKDHTCDDVCHATVERRAYESRQCTDMSHGCHTFVKSSSGPYRRSHRGTPWHRYTSTRW